MSKPALGRPQNKKTRSQYSTTFDSNEHKNTSWSNSVRLKRNGVFPVNKPETNSTTE